MHVSYKVSRSHEEPTVSLMSAVISPAPRGERSARVETLMMYYIIINIIIITAVRKQETAVDILKGKDVIFPYSGC